MKTAEENLIGKKIIKAEVIKIQPSSEYIGKTYSDCYSNEEIEGWDDEPILRLTMEDGSVFEIESDYGGYTGGSQDEYPRFIKVKEIKKEGEE